MGKGRGGYLPNAPHGVERDAHHVDQIERHAVQQNEAKQDHQHAPAGMEGGGGGSGNTK